MNDPSPQPGQANPSPRRRCTANNRRGEPCKARPIKGGTVCVAHGGRAPQVKAAAARRQAEAAAAAALETYGLPVDTDPTEALLSEVKRTAGHVAWLHARVQELDPEALIWGTTEKVRKGAVEFPGTDVTEAAEVHVWLKLYQAERKHLVDVCRVALAANIDERRVRLAERQGEVLVGLIQGILADLALTAEQQAMVPEVVPRRLRAIAA